MERIHCKFLDGTDVVTCRWEGPYRATRNKPTLARGAFGADPRVNHRQEGNILICRPAEEAEQKRIAAQNAIPSQDTSEAKKLRYGILAEKQSTCNHYQKLGT